MHKTNRDRGLRVRRQAGGWRRRVTGRCNAACRTKRRKRESQQREKNPRRDVETEALNEHTPSGSDDGILDPMTPAVKRRASL